MGSNYWMFVDNSENSAITRQKGYKIFGMSDKYKRRAQRMHAKDRVIFFDRNRKCWTASATIISDYFEDESRIWVPIDKHREYKFRITLKPDYVLDEEQYIDGLQLGPSLEYVKRWAPEDWPLAFWDRIHLLPSRDFKLIEDEMKRAKKQRQPREQNPASIYSFPSFPPLSFCSWNTSLIICISSLSKSGLSADKQ